MNGKPVFWLACACLIALAALGVAEICVGSFENLDTVKGLLEMLKFTGAVSLGFFLATACNGNDKDKNKDKE